MKPAPAAKRFLSALIIITLGSLVLLEAGLRVSGYLLRAKVGWQKDKSGQKHVILCAGDSFVYGIGGTSFPSQLEKILNERAGGERYKVYNTGVPGSNTAIAAAKLEKEIYLYRPDTLIFLAGSSNFWNTIYSGGQSGWRARLDAVAIHSATYRFFKQLAMLPPKEKPAAYNGLEGNSPGTLAVSSASLPAQDIVPTEEGARISSDLARQGSDALAKGNGEHGIAILKTALQKDPACLFCYKNLLSYAGEKGDAGLIKQYYYQSLKVKGNNFPPMFNAGFAALLGDKISAVWFYDKAIDTVPSDACRELISIQSSGGDFRSAEQSVHKCLDKGVAPDSVYRTFIMGVNPFKNPTDVEAFARNEIYARRAKSPELYHGLLQSQIVRATAFDSSYALKEELVKTVSEAAALYPDSFEIMDDAARAMLVLNRFDDLAGHISALKSLAGDDTARLAELAYLQYFYDLNGGRNQEALVQAGRYVSLSGNMAEAEYLRGHAAFVENKYEEANRHFLKTMGMNPDPRVMELSCWESGLSFMAENNFVKARDMFVRVVDLNSAQMGAYNLLYEAASRAGQEGQIAEVLVRGLQKNPGLWRIVPLIRRSLSAAGKAERDRLAAIYPILDDRQVKMRLRLKNDGLSRNQEEWGMDFRDNDVIYRDYTTVSRLAARHGVRLILSSYPEIVFSEARKVAEENHVAYVDMPGVFSRKFKSRVEWISYDDLHCNSVGYRAMAEAYADMILPPSGLSTGIKQ